VLGLGFTACGSDGGNEATGDTTTTTGDGTGDTTGDTTDGTIGDLPAGLVDEDCAFLLAGAFLNPLAITQGAPGANIDESAAELQAIADKAPDEIKDAMEVITDRYSQMAEALKDVDLSDPQSYTSPEVQQALQGLDDLFDDEYEAATQTVSDYVQDNCA
jgi:hypothetical protein